jgi:hypothetical protein
MSDTGASDYEYDEYVSTPQRLGEEGITRACVQAMAAILTSSFKPTRITLVSHPKTGLHGSHAFDRVMFVIWEWVNHSIFTVVPDGFGTHGGEGGAGLSSVLGLIRYYKTPLYHAVISNDERFHRLASGGKIDDALFRIFKQARPYNWNYYPADTVRLVKSGKDTFLEVDYWQFRI